MKKLCFFFFFSILISRSYSQISPQPKWQAAPSGSYRCFTDEVDAWRSGTSNANTKRKSFESWIKNQLNAISREQGMGRNVPVIYNIPVVFHIIHSGEAAGTGTNIGASYVNAQIQQLNNDFRKIAGTSGYNSHAFGADVMIQFCAATLDPADATLAEAGIQRINKAVFGVTNPPFTINYIENTIKPNSIWDANRYLNFWVLDLNGLLGYAQFPDSPNELGVGVNNSANTDGVVVHYNTVGSSNQKFPGGYPYDEGRTLTHEVGHWLGLRHIWGDGDCTTDDFVFDTPRASAPHFGCAAATTNSCNDITYGSAADSNDMVRNYMDYSDDRCMDIFTIGQKNRMRIVMGETGAGAPRRASLRLSDRCQAGPKVSLVLTDTTVMEKTDCMVNRAYSIPVRMSRAPNATTTVTLTQTTGTANANDITISPASVEFSATDMGDKNFTVTVRADAVMEGHEMAYFNLGVTGSNATAAADSFELLIMNDDWMPANGKRIPATLLSENFEGTITGWIANDYVVGNNTWLVGGTNGNMNGSKSAYISNDNSSHQYDAGSTSHSIFYREVDATAYDSLNLSLYYISKGEKTAGINYDYGKIVYSLDSITFHQLNGTADLVDSSNMTFLSVQIPYFLWNRKFYMGFYWENDGLGGTDPPFAVDDITLSGKRWMPAMIQTAADTTSGYDEKPVGPNEIVDFYDKITGDIIATIADVNGFNWGCVKVEVDRSGTGAQWVTGDPQTNMQTKLFDKTYKITPTNNNASGRYNVMFYLTQAEVNGWQTATGAPLGIARVIKYSGKINDMTYTSSFEQNMATTGAYLGGADWTISSAFNTGFSGFGFGYIPPGVLPVRLLSFTGEGKNKTCLLKWKTENEENISQYIVQRSRDGIRFENIGTVMARGGAGPLQYQFTDVSPLSGKNYYRLSMAELNGAGKFSSVVAIAISHGAYFTILANPFADKLEVKVENAAGQTINAVITDISGKIILQNKFVMAGSGFIQFDTHSLSSGMYYLSADDGSGMQTFKVVKQ